MSRYLKILPVRYCQCSSSKKKWIINKSQFQTDNSYSYSWQYCPTTVGSTVGNIASGPAQARPGTLRKMGRCGYCNEEIRYQSDHNFCRAIIFWNEAEGKMFRGARKSLQDAINHPKFHEKLRIMRELDPLQDDYYLYLRTAYYITMCRRRLFKLCLCPWHQIY